MAPFSTRRTAAAYVGCAVSTIQNTADRDAGFAAQLGHAEHQAEISYLKFPEEFSSFQCFCAYRARQEFYVRPVELKMGYRANVVRVGVRKGDIFYRFRVYTQGLDLFNHDGERCASAPFDE